MSGQHGHALFQARSIGEAAALRLMPDGRRTAIVHSVYRRAINVLCPTGIISLLSDEFDPSPINVTLAVDKETDLTTFGLRPGDRAQKLGPTLNMGDGAMLVSLQDAQRYVLERLFPEPIKSAERLGHNLEAGKRAALALGHLQGFGQMIGLIGEEGLSQQRPGDLNVFARNALPRVSALLEAIQETNSVEVRHKSRELAGLGPGLTPSADDMLSGIMLAMMLYGRNQKRHEDKVKSITTAVLSGSRGRTTLLSEEYLRQAAIGNGNEGAVSLCREMLTGEPSSVQREVARVVTLGATSGTDMVLGIMLGIYVVMNWRG